jgi:hypothetical protein
MTLRPIAPHEVGEMGEKRTAYRPLLQVRVEIMGRVGEAAPAGITGSRANPRIRNP